MAVLAMLVRSMAAPGDMVFVVNPRSGGGAGRRLLADLQARFTADRAVAIGETDLPALIGRWHGRAAALVACGGDGTAAALLDGAWRTAPGAPTPVAVWPLGTGNDLARQCAAPLGGPMDLRLAWLAAAQARPLDRWLLSGPTGERAWFNYCSWGCDARIAQRFHRLRDLHPWAFASSLTNKAYYAGIGLQELGSPLALRLGGDGVSGPIPAWTRSLVLANIPSYAGGRRLGSHIAMADGRCDAFALPSGIALGIGLSGIRRPRALGSHRQLDLRLARPAFLQIDGEPLTASPGAYRVVPGGRVQLLMQGSAAS